MIKTVHVVQTCHLDVGFAKLAAGELTNYHQYLLEAASIAADFHTNPGKNGEGLVFTTHPYVVSLLLDCPPGFGFACPTPAEQTTIREAIRRGDIVMQAFPFNSDASLYTPALFASALNMTKRLAAELGVAAPTVMTQRDVPGAPRGIVPLLSEHGIVAYSSGVNGASLPPAVPRAFVWRDEASSASILGTVHPFGYGGISVDDCILVPQRGAALCPDYKGDNAGPWSRSEIEGHWKVLMAEFPNATTIKPSSFDSFMPELEAVRDSLPVVTKDLADTWIFGMPSDPWKLAAFRAAMRIWEDACLAGGRTTKVACNPADPRVQNFTRLLIKSAEHTWGCDIKTYLHDEGNWTNDKFEAVRSSPNFQFVEQSWQEQRDWGINFPLDALGNHPLAAAIQAELALLHPTQPFATTGMTREPDPTKTFTLAGGIEVAFDNTGAIAHGAADGDVWASPANVLGRFQYQVHSTQEYIDFFNLYAQRTDGKIPSYFPLDFGKPGLYNNSVINIATKNPATVQQLWSDVSSGRFVLELAMANQTLVTDYGAPQSIFIEVNVTAADAGGALAIDWGLLVLNKTATRLPESLWMIFEPTGNSDHWRLDKLGNSLDPLDVNLNASRHLHGVDRGITIEPAAGGGHTTRLSSLDCGVVSIGDTNPFPTPSGDWQPKLDSANFALFDNIMGTNVVMWSFDPSYFFRFHYERAQK